MVEQIANPEDHADFGILLGLAYQAFVDQLRTDLERRGFPDLTPTVGYVVRAIAASATYFVLQVKSADPAEWNSNTVVKSLDIAAPAE